MAKILMVYESKEGQTQKIARFISDELRRQGHKVDELNTEKPPGAVDILKYDGVIAGAPIHMSSYPKHFHHFIEKNAGTLSLVRNAFFTVCLGVLEDSEKTRHDIKRIQEKFFVHVRWLPMRHEVFAGALAYTKYNWLVRWFLKKIAARAGGATDTSKDYEYTDWNKVLQFTQIFANHLPHKELDNHP